MKILRYKRKLMTSLFLNFPHRAVRAWALRQCGFEVADAYIGNNLTVTMGLADHNQKLIIEDRVAIAPNVTLILASHPNDSVLHKMLVPPTRKIVIKHDAWLGTGSIIMPGITIGECAIVGAGVVVTHDVPSYTVVGGNPARVIKTINMPKK